MENLQKKNYVLCKPHAMEKDSEDRLFQCASRILSKESKRVIPQGKAKCNVITAKAESSKCELHTI